MSKRDYYEILGVSRTSTEIELKAAFRKLAMQHHPDRNPGDKDCEHRFKEINEAYDVLKDGDKRAAYDRFGHAAFEHGGMGRPWFRRRLRFDFCRYFRRHFRNGSTRGRGSGRERGSDLRYNMEISLDEAFTGKTAQIRIPTSVTCEACSGSGAKAGTKPKCVRAVVVPAKFATRRAFSRSNAPARPVMAAARLSTTLARCAAAEGG